MTSAEDQHAPGTGQPGVVVTEIASGHGNLTAWANELAAAAAELARKHRLALVGGETRIVTVAEQPEQAESDFDHYFNATRRLNSEVESLRQQLAAAQAERERWDRQFATTDDYTEALREQRDQLRAQVEELRQRASAYETAEGTAIAQRNAALNEALAYKYQAEAMRGVAEAVLAAPFTSEDGLDRLKRLVAMASAALDAASAGQPKSDA